MTHALSRDNESPEAATLGQPEEGTKSLNQPPFLGDSLDSQDVALGGTEARAGAPRNTANRPTSTSTQPNALEHARPSSVVAPIAYYNPGPLPSPSEVDTSGTVALAIVAGGFIGLTAAAAVRWLNGGDFHLFPPATIAPSSRQASSQEREEREPTRTDQTQTSATSQEREQNMLLEQSIAMENIVSRMHSQVEQHEKLLVQLQTMQQHSTTEVETVGPVVMHDQSIDLFLRYDDTNTRTILREIRSAINNLQSDHPEFAVRLQRTLDKLDTTLDGMPRTQTVLTTPIGLTRQASKQSSNINNTSLATALSQLVLDNPDVAKRQSASQMLYLYVVNLSSHPKVPRYRKIYTSNETYQRNVENVIGAAALLQAVGFVQRGNAWEWESDEDEDAIDRLRQAAAALSILKVVDPQLPLPSTLPDLLQHVLEKVGLPPPPTTITTTTPPRHTIDRHNKNDNNNSNPDAFTTPVHADILSPPVTKKQLTPPLEVDFPVLTHPSKEIAPSKDLALEELSFLEQKISESEEDDSGEAALWK